MECMRLCLVGCTALALAGCGDEELAGLEAMTVAETGNATSDPDPGFDCGQRRQRDFPVAVVVRGYDDISVNFDNGQIRNVTGCSRVSPVDADSDWFITCPVGLERSASVVFNTETVVGAIAFTVWLADTDVTCDWSYELRDIEFSYCGDPGFDCP